MRDERSSLIEDTNRMRRKTDVCPDRSDGALDRWAGERRLIPLPHPNYKGRGPKGYRRSDERIREDLSDRFTDDERLDASEITIHVRHGEVTLTGSVEDRAHERRAEDLAAATSGVLHVTNHLRVGPPTGDVFHPEAGSPVASAGRPKPTTFNW